MSDKVFRVCLLVSSFGEVKWLLCVCRIELDSCQVPRYWIKMGHHGGFFTEVKS